MPDADLVPGARHVAATGPPPAAPGAPPDRDAAAAPPDERPFTTLERTICLSDRPGAPIIVGLLARLNGRVDADSLRAAALAVLAAHPMASARRHPDPAAGSRWQFPAAPDVEPVIVIDAEDAGAAGDDERRGRGPSGEAGPDDQAEGRPDDRRAEAAFALLCDQASDLALSPSLRIGLLRLRHTDALGLVAHHAALDGGALLVLLTELLARVRGTDDAPAGHRRAGAPGAPVTGAAAVGHPPRRRRRVGRARPARYLVPATANPGSGYGVVSIAVATPVPPDGATVNDALVAAAHRAVERWNDECGRSTGTVRLRMPMNLRAHGAGAGDTDDVANASGQTAVVTAGDERADVRALFAAVTRQTAAAKASGGDGDPDPTGALWFVPARARDSVARAAIGLARGFMMPSATLSNLGRVAPLAVAGGGPAVTGLAFFPFAGMPQGLAIGATGYGGRLQLGFSYHRALFDEAAALRFATVYAEALSGLRGG